MSNTHTPGPWATSSADETVVLTAYESGRAFVASTLAFNSSVADARDHANARLIAAAPDLLAALEDAEFLLRKAGQLSGPMQDSFKRSASDARAAIAKARDQS